MENFRIQIRSLKILGSGSATLYKFYEYRGNPSTVLAVIHLIAVILSRRGSPQCDKKKLDIEISRRTNTKIFHPFFHNLKKGITAFNIINLMARIRDITFNNVKQFLANERERERERENMIYMYNFILYLIINKLQIDNCKCKYNFPMTPPLSSVGLS